MTTIRLLLKPLPGPGVFAGEGEMGEARVSRVRLGSYEFDLKSGELRSGERCVVLQRQPHKILAMLVTYPGQFVTRDEIQHELWPQGVVVNFEVSINQAISKLRHALNDSAFDPQLIETVGRRGYRLKVPVTASLDQSTQEALFDNAIGNAHLLQRLAEEIAVVCGREERELLTAALVKLLHILARMEAPCEEPLVSVSHDGGNVESQGSPEAGRA